MTLEPLFAEEFEPPREPISKPYIWCHLCNDSGAVVAVPKDGSSGDFFFRCSCKKGEWNRGSFPKWSDADKRVYELAKVQASKPAARPAGTMQQREVKL
jgi:hypothetical protein